MHVNILKFVDASSQGYAPNMTQPALELTPRRIPTLRSAERARLQRRARLLAWTGNAWHLIEFAVALGAGIAAGSIALVGFGVDSLIEGLSGFVVIWLFTGRRLDSVRAELHAQRLIAVGYFLLAAYVAAESLRDLASGHHPAVSWIGIGLAAFTAPAMPVLARAKAKVGRALDSSAAVSEAGQNMLCAYLSIALLVGLLLNALAGIWWADPAAALVIAAVALREGRESWHGDACDCC
jgi:divalent metal cation (Fe/Co/Zn/Cd) transporter